MAGQSYSVFFNLSLVILIQCVLLGFISMSLWYAARAGIRLLERLNRQARAGQLADTTPAKTLEPAGMEISSPAT